MWNELHHIELDTLVISHLVAAFVGFIAAARI